jgi:hypothetical protein
MSENGKVISVIPSTHNSPETAYIIFFYPWGNNRTIQRTWIETPTKGAGKGQQRQVTQSANKPWLYEYTKRCNEVGTMGAGIEAANAWALEEVKANRVPWCAPKASTYSGMRIIALVPFEDAPDGKLKTYSDGLTPYSGESWYTFHDKYIQFLDDDQKKRLESIGRVTRHLSPTSWHEIEVKRTAENLSLYELPAAPPKLKA